MPAPDPTWDFLSPASKGQVLAALRDEFETVWSLVSDPLHWGSPTGCAGWDTADMVGHLLDVTSGYVAGFDAARRNEHFDGGPMPSMADAYDEAARSYRSVSREELLERLRADTDRLL